MNSVTFIVEIFFSLTRPPGEVQINASWIKERFKIFEKYTLPSLINQSFQDFRIFILCGEKHKAVTEKLPWHKRVEVYHVKGEKESSNPKRMRPASKVKGYDSIDTDYISITRINSDDLFHRNLMAEIRDSISPNGNGSALFMRRYLIWDILKNYVAHRVILSRCSPHYTHVFPRSIYKNWSKFIEQHYINHRFAVANFQEKKEILGWKACEVRHAFNISDIKKGYIADLKCEKITDKKKVNKIIKEFRCQDMKIDISLLSWNFPDMTLKCLETLKAETKMPYRLIWVDNGSERENFERVKKYVETFEDHIIFRFNSNRYYAEGTNKGIKLSDTKYVVTLSNDVFVTEGWLKKLVKIMEKQPEIGMISPLTDNIGSNCPRASLTVPEHELLRPGEPLERINDLPSRFAYCEGEISRVSMFCALLRKKMVNEIGLLDERFTCYGNDFDYNDRIKQSDWKLAVVLNCFVYHIHKATKNEVFSNLIERAKIRQDHKILLSEKQKIRAEGMEV